MRYTGLIAAALAAVLSAGPVAAEVAALGSTQKGGTSQVGRSLAAAISEASDLQMRPQELANTADYIPLVNAGEMEFGISNIVQLGYAVSGTGMSEGRPNPNLRMVATLMPFRNAYVVRRDSGIETIADLEGKRVPVFAERALGDYVTRGYFANAGLGLDGVEGVAVPNFPRMWAAFAEGSVDVAIVVVGAGNSREYDASFGIRYLSFEDSPEAVARMNEYMPQSYLAEVGPDAKIPGIDEPTNVNVFDYTLFAGKDVSDDMVYAATKALWEKQADLVAQGPVWSGFARERMGKDLGVEYHPGAIRFYKEMGVWAE
ncbi:TAXI family TRAP transporter solute-binding subunit [Pikeienuella piscinae]|uniref:TAXI family TRAP transporter solute-binding subunit n=1 Tax=Pikeienuella piscinae TaxID=2748098 RepID=A0A7M3T5H9_9RHOB|nr:TAXI family TRAP transporter solute-binding subunit [Pikeienuella piscinae]QIE57260.1 TAXI family TRAP transporter solute-binding subunit [Pikeienuella piscinae]